MGRGTTARKKDLTGPKVENVSLNEAHLRLRFLLAVLILLLGAGTLTWAVSSALGRDEGWNEITVSDPKTACAQEYTFHYQLGQGKQSAAAENKALTVLYTEATDRACLLTDPFEETEGENNLASLNLHPNETLEMDPWLWEKLRQLTEAGDWLYLGPVQEEYRSLFSAQTAEEAGRFDPLCDPESAQFVAEVMNYIHDGAIRLVFPAENTVRLEISEAYLDFARRTEIETFLDAGILTDALILDYTADKLLEAGYTEGSLSSLSGFTRVLSPQIELTVTCYSRSGNTVSPVGTQTLSDVYSVMVLKSFPLSENEYWYKDLGGGEIRTDYLDTRDGLCKTAGDFWLGSSPSADATSLALALLPLYASADCPAAETLQTLADREILVQIKE